MSLDTATKRGSAIGEFSFCEVLPFPDGAVGNADWAQVAWAYAGTLTGGEVEPVYYAAEFTPTNGTYSAFGRTHGVSVGLLRTNGPSTAWVTTHGTETAFQPTEGTSTEFAR